MKFITALFLVFSISITAQFKVKLKKVESIFIEIDSNQAINKGRAITFRAFARLKNGKVKSINSHPKFSLIGNGLKHLRNNSILITPNNDCISEVYSFEYALNDEYYQFKEIDSVRLNYKGGLQCDYSGAGGANGIKGDKEGFVGGMIRDRDGRDGKPGADGEDGVSGPYLKAYIRPDSLFDFILVDVFNLENNKVYCYKLLNINEGIMIDVTGGNGGNGGDGRAGQDGRNEVEKSNGKTKRSGNGGNGGRGGNGGNGGVGGIVELYVHSSLKSSISSISIINNGGKKGNVGTGGAKGNAGENLNGSKTSIDGVSGDSGMPGMPGLKGEVKEFQFVDDLNFKLF